MVNCSTGQTQDNVVRQKKRMELPLLEAKVGFQSLANFVQMFINWNLCSENRDSFVKTLITAGGPIKMRVVAESRRDNHTIQYAVDERNAEERAVNRLELHRSGGG